MTRNDQLSQRSPFYRAAMMATKLLVVLIVLYGIYKLFHFGNKVYKAWSMDAAVSELSQSTAGIDAVPEVTLMSAAARFIAIGDMGANSPEQRVVADAIEAHCVSRGGLDGLLFLGDIIYPRGVNSVTDARWQTHFEDYYRQSPCLKEVTIYPVLGNHDYLGEPGVWLERAKGNDKFYFPKRSWTRSFGDIVTLFGIDTEFPWLDGMQSIETALPDNKAKSRQWRVALGHHPIASASKRVGRHTGSGLTSRHMRDVLCNRVDLYLSGHAHHLEHRTINNCTDIIVSGAGGAGLQSVDENDPSSQFVIGQFGFVELTISSAELDVRVFNRNGDKVYGYTKLASNRQ